MSTSPAVGPMPGLAAPVSPLASRLTPVDPLRLFRQHISTLIVAGVVGVVLGVVVWALLLWLSPRYTSYAQLLAVSQAPDPFSTVQDPLVASTEAQNFFIQNQVIRLRSDDVISEALRDPDLRATQWFRNFGPDPSDPNNPDEVRKAEARRIENAKYQLQKRNALKAWQVRGSTTIMVSLTGREREELDDVLDVIIRVYLNRLRLEGESDTSDLRRAFVNERNRAEDDLRQIQERIRQFTIENDLPNLQPQYNEAQIAYQLIADQEAKLRVAYTAAKDAYEALLRAQQENRLAPTPEDIAQVERDPAVATRDERLRQLREERMAAVHRFGENHYSVKELDRRIAATEQERQREFERLIAERMQVRLAEAQRTAESLEAQLAGIQPRLEEARNKMRDLSIKLQSYQTLADQLKTATERRDRAEQMLDEVRVRTNRPDFIRVRRQMAPTPAELTFPMYYVVIPGVLILTLAVTVAGLYAKEALDQRIKSPSDLGLVGKLELLGVIPEAAEDPNAPARVESVVQDDPKGLMAEMFRQVRTVLVAEMDRKGYRTLLVVSPQPEGGASTVASNIAMSLAYIGRKVLLVDANLRRPNQHNIFGIPQQPGLAEVLRGTVAVDTAIFHKVEPTIDILPVGNVQDLPPEMLEGTGFRQLLSQLEKSYDMVILDVAPALLTSDCQMLAKHADAIVVVCRAMVDKRGMLSRLLRQVEDLRAQVVGVVLNRARSSAGGYFRQVYETFYAYREPGRRTAVQTVSAGG